MDLLELLKGQPATTDDAGMTSLEIAEKLGLSVRTVLPRLKVEHQAGRIVSGWAYRPSLKVKGDGTPIAIKVPVYRSAE
jgi:predicted transcriptional regulator